MWISRNDLRKFGITQFSNLIHSSCLLFFWKEQTRAESDENQAPEPDEIFKVIKEVVHLARQINLKVDSDDVQEMPDSPNQEPTTDELIEMHKEEQDIKEL
ncbi:hypothetical protein TNCV_4712871 [Trichonephila clavipes]|nr:hypothetical protein TNCV_4712871 [Trichonephila clavipes]